MKESTDTSPYDEFVSREEHQRVLSEVQLLRAVLNQLPAELVVIDQDLRYLFANKEAVKDDELREWIIGKTDAEFWERKNKKPELSIQRNQRNLEVILHQQEVQFEESFHAGTPEEKHYIRLIRPSPQDNSQKYIIVYGQNVTALKLTEKQLRAQNEELEKVNHELDQFVYSASHNLRAPLLSVKGLLSLIEDEAAEAPSRAHFIGEIHKSINRLDSTIRDIIDYSKNARLPLDPTPVNLEELINNTHEDLRFYEGNSVSLELRIDQSAPFFSDEKRLKSIIHNIMSNSVKYADPAKAQSQLRINVHIDEQQCRMIFHDNGQGISAENKTKIFDMFFRGTAQRSGSGLGLYIVKEMTERIGGTVTVESILGESTTFELTLPNLR